VWRDSGTSAGTFDALDWPDVDDGLGSTDNLGAEVHDAKDECILLYQRVRNAAGAQII
jgi:hypothetical protein